MELEDDGLQAWHHHEELLQQRFLLEQSRTVFQRNEERTMSIVAKDNSGGDRKFELAPAGAHIARCFRIIDLGTQTFQVKGETKQAHQCLLTWELGKTMSDGKPYTINEKFSLSLNEKSRLSAILEGWRGIKFTDEQRRGGFDIQQMLGKLCFLNVVHSNRGDKTFANVASAMPVPDGMPEPRSVNSQLYFSLSTPDQNVLEALPKYYRELIEKSPEYQRMNSKVAVAAGSADLDDDLPF